MRKMVYTIYKAKQNKQMKEVIQMLKLSLETVAQIINDNTNIKCHVGQCYRDYGVNLMHTTIISTEPKRYQMLNNREVDDIQSGIFTIEEVEELVNDINKRGW